MLRRPSPATVLSLVALFIALSGTSYAALTISGKNVKNGSLTGADVKNSSLRGTDVKNNSLRGADVVESKLGKVGVAKEADHAKSADSAGTAGNATSVGGQGVAALADQSTVAVPFADDCTPGAAFTDCGSAAVTLPRAGRLVMLGELPYQSEETDDTPSRGQCRYLLNGQFAAMSVIFGTDDPGSGGATPYSYGGVFNAQTNPLPAGRYTVALQCQNLSGEIHINPARVTVLTASPA